MIYTLKAIWQYDIFHLWYTPESNGKIHCYLNGNELEKYASIYVNIDQLQKQLFAGNGMTLLQILEKLQESNRSEVLFQYSYRLCNVIKTWPNHGCFWENFPKF